MSSAPQSLPDATRSIACAVDTALSHLVADGDEVGVEMPDAYRRGAPCRVRVRRRGDRFDMDDLGAAVELAGRPAGWLAEGRSVVAREGFNINRQGRVFVQGFAGRDIDDLADRLAEVSRAVHEALLSLDD